MFYVIEFETGEVEVVPVSWVKDNYVSWSKTARSYAIKNFQPKPTWKTYKCTIRYKNEAFDSYQDATEKCNHLLKQTDSSDSNDNYLSELQKRRTKSASHDPDFVYYSDGYIDNMPDSPKSTEGDNDKTLTPLEETSVPEITGKPKVLCSGDGPINLEDLIINPSHCKCDDLQRTFTEKLDLIKDGVSALKQKTLEIKNRIIENSELIEKFIYQSKREWEAVKFAVNNISSTKNNTPQVNTDLKQVFDDLLPLSSMDDVNILNEILQEEEKLSYFIRKLKKIGGKDAKKKVSNIIKDCFTVETQKKCNWSGANNKFRIKGTPLANEIINVLLETENITKDEVEKILQYIFQHTYDREKAEQLKSKQKQ